MSVSSVYAQNHNGECQMTTKNTSTDADKSVPATKQATAKPAAKETHIADKIKSFPKRRVWPD